MAEMDDIKFTREDLPEDMKDRAAWMIQVTRLMRLRGWLQTKWVNLSKMVLEGRSRLPRPPIGFQNGESSHLSLPESLSDLYHAAHLGKPRFDEFVMGACKVFKPKRTEPPICFESWEEWQAKVDVANHSKIHAVTEAAAALDAVHCSVVQQPLKDKERTTEKAKENYHGKLRKVKDVVRCRYVLIISVC